MKINRDLSVGLGGPVMKDKLWFFFSARRWGVDQYINNSFYNLDPTHRTWQPDASRQVVDNNLIKSARTSADLPLRTRTSTRRTWIASSSSAAMSADRTCSRKRAGFGIHAFITPRKRSTPGR